MKELTSNGNGATQILFPYEPQEFWESMRQIIREEVHASENLNPYQLLLKQPE